jgi:outer membrane protein OmpA-like peptidoglycan-associated protein
MDKFNIAGDRMMIKGYGSQKPIADNKSKEGRAKNRRVEFRVIP